MHVDQAFCDRKAKTGALFCRLDRIGTLTERSKHDRDFVLGDAGAGVLDAEILPARSGPAYLQPDLAARRGEFDGVRQQIEHDLPYRALISPNSRHVLLEHLVNGDAAARGTQLQQMMTIGHDMDERNRLFVELIAPGLDARQ